MEMSACPGGDEGSGKGFVLWERVHYLDGGCGGPGGVHLLRRVSGANTAGFGWEANEVRRAGIRIMSGANTELRSTCLTSRGS